TAAQLETELADYKARYSEAALQGNRRELAVLDPLRDSGFSNPLSSNQPLKRDTKTLVVRLVLLGVAGATLGALLFLARNKLAERSLYAAVRKADTAAAYEAYLSRGGRRPEVSAVLLPIAQLRDARGSLEQVDAYSAAPPTRPTRGRIHLALRR